MSHPPSTASWPRRLALLCWLLVGANSPSQVQEHFKAPKPATLIVACVDSHGQPEAVPNERIDLTQITRLTKSWHPNHHWARNQRILLVRPAFDPVSPRKWRRQSMGTRESQSEFSWTVTPGESYFIGSVGPNLRTRFQRVTVPQDGRDLRVELALPNPIPSGTLRINWHINPEHWSALQWKIVDPHSHAVFMRGGLRGIPRGPISLPVGEYRLIVEGTHVIGCYPDLLQSKCALGQTRTDFSILPNQETTQEFLLVPGGFLNVWLDCDWLCEDTDSLKKPGLTGLVQPENTASLWLFSLSDPQEAICQVDLQAPRGSGVSVYFPLKEWTESLMVPAGDFLLVARMPGGRRVTQRVSIEPTQTTQVVITGHW